MIDPIHNPLQMVGMILIISGVFVIFVLPTLLEKSLSAKSGSSDSIGDKQARDDAIAKHRKYIVMAGVIDIAVGVLFLLNIFHV